MAIAPSFVDAEELSRREVSESTSTAAPWLGSFYTYRATYQVLMERAVGSDLRLGCIVRRLHSTIMAQAHRPLSRVPRSESRRIQRGELLGTVCISGDHWHSRPVVRGYPATFFGDTTAQA